MYVFLDDLEICNLPNSGRRGGTKTNEIKENLSLLGDGCSLLTTG
jgi:hypothetical protein